MSYQETCRKGGQTEPNKRRTDGDTDTVTLSSDSDTDSTFVSDGYEHTGYPVPGTLWYAYLGTGDPGYMYRCTSMMLTCDRPLTVTDLGTLGTR